MDFVKALEAKRSTEKVKELETEEPKESPVDEAELEKMLEQERMQVVTKPEETENFIHIPVRDKGLFNPESFRTISISKSEGISAVAGKLKNPPICFHMRNQREMKLMKWKRKLIMMKISQLQNQ